MPKMLQDTTEIRVVASGLTSRLCVCCEHEKAPFNCKQRPSTTHSAFQLHKAPSNCTLIRYGVNTMKPAASVVTIVSGLHQKKQKKACTSR
eukprot:4463417-Pleurochrysis_carterae.AAC.2